MRMLTTYPNTKKQSGASIVLAVFLMVILGLMGVGMVSLLATSQQSISQELTSAKTYMASRSCLQWAMYQSIYSPLTLTSPPVDNTVTFISEGTATITFNDTASALYKTQCDMKIELTNVDNGNDSKDYYNITSEAKYGSTSDPEYSKRTLFLQFQLP